MVAVYKRFQSVTISAKRLQVAWIIILFVAVNVVNVKLNAVQRSEAARFAKVLFQFNVFVACVVEKLFITSATTRLVNLLTVLFSIAFLWFLFAFNAQTTFKLRACSKSFATHFAKYSKKKALLNEQQGF